MHEHRVIVWREDTACATSNNHTSSISNLLLRDYVAAVQVVHARYSRLTIRMAQTANVRWMTELTPKVFRIQLLAAKMGSSTMHVTVIHSPISISLPPTYIEVMSDNSCLG